MEGNSRSRRRLTRSALVVVAACAIALPVGAAYAAPTEGTAADALPAPPPFVPAADPIPEDATEYERQIALAEIGVAGADGAGIMAPNWCFGTPRPPELSDESELGPVPLMDNAAYLGMVTVGQVTLDTADGGFILFDTLYDEEDVETLTKPGLVELGLDPADLRAIIVTHGHLDHDGGAKALQDEFDVPVYIGSGDTEGKEYDPTLIDSTALEPVDLTIGGTTVIALASPGHSDGTVSFILPTTYQGQSHPLAFWGGSGLSANASLSNALGYMESAGRMWELVRETGADASINSHTFFDQSKARIDEIIANGGISESNPMIQGNDVVLRSFYVLRQCAAAAVAQRDETAENPIWRMTETDVFAAKLGALPAGAQSVPLTVGARLSNVFEVLEGQQVTFAAGGASCIGTTDADGVATCTLDVTPADEITIDASFAGRSVAAGDEVDLPSDGSLAVAGQPTPEPTPTPTPEPTSPTPDPTTPAPSPEPTSPSPTTAPSAPATGDPSPTTPVPSADDGRLAATGSSIDLTLAAAAIGGLLLVGGAVLLRARRRS
ncbi:MBL fold metallo-hydrolase [Microbacterium sp. NPDC077184]|uniref:MBL fold metallo-hydrolase n=1 Tax=Microbacterium sp. NPDC077184 TaxID=3154764 RepID=UPI003449DB55